MGRDWHGAQGLADDIRYYGKWMRDEAEKRIGHLYPKVMVTAQVRVSIHLFSSDTMPSDIQQIKIIMINPTNLPPVQLSPVSASPTPTTYSASFLRGYMRQF